MSTPVEKTPAGRMVLDRQEHIKTISERYLPPHVIKQLRVAVTDAYDAGIEEGRRREQLGI